MTIEMICAAYESRAEAAKSLVEECHPEMSELDVVAYDHLATIFRQIRDGKETFGGALDTYRAAKLSDDPQEKDIAKIVVHWLEIERAKL